MTVTAVDKLGDHNGAISSLDASAVARGAVGRETLSTNQRVAGDVTGNGALSAWMPRTWHG